MRKSLCAVCIASLMAYTSFAKDSSGEVPRVFISPFKTAASFNEIHAGETNANWKAVALGKVLLTARLVQPDLKFVCVSELRKATYNLESVLTTLRSKENVYKSSTYGVETKTTNWQLDLIVQLRRRADGVIVFSRTVTGSCNEQRPISEAKFDNDLFHTLMVAAIEEAAEEIVGYFEPETSDGVSSVVSSVGSGGAVGYRQVSANRANEKKLEVKERESLAVMKPRAGTGISDEEAVMLWDFLESKLGGGLYTVVSRADVSRMMDEIGLTTSSYLSDPMSRKRARVGKLATVSKLLAPSVGRFGNRYLLTLKVFDSSTAEIDAARSESVSSETLDGLLPLAAVAMRQILASPPEGIALAPVGITAPGAPAWLAPAVFDGVNAALARAGIAVKTEAGAEAAVTLVPSVPVYSLRLVDEGGRFRYRGDIVLAVSANGAPPVSVELTDVDLGKVEGAAPSWLTKERGQKLLALAMENMAQKLSSLRVK